MDNNYHSVGKKIEHLAFRTPNLTTNLTPNSLQRDSIEFIAKIKTKSPEKPKKTKPFFYLHRIKSYQSKSEDVVVNFITYLDRQTMLFNIKQQFIVTYLCLISP